MDSNPKSTFEVVLGSITGLMTACGALLIGIGKFRESQAKRLDVNCQVNIAESKRRSKNGKFLSLVILAFQAIFMISLVVFWFFTPLNVVLTERTAIMLVIALVVLLEKF